MTLRRPRDSAKERYWRKVIADWEISALPGAEYCRRHNIPYSQFQDWRKTIARRNKEIEQRTAELQSEHSARLAARRAKVPDKKPGSRAVTPEQTAPGEGVQFAEVQLVERPMAGMRIAEPVIAASAPLEIVLQNGILLRINSEHSLQLLSAVVSLLEDR